MSEKVYFGGNYRRYLNLPDPPAPVAEKRPVGRPSDVDQTIPRRVLSLRFSHALHDLLFDVCRVQNKSRVKVIEEIFTAVLPWMLNSPGPNAWVTAAQEESDQFHEQYFAEKRAK